MAKSNIPIEITIIGRDNTSLKDCIDEQIDNLSVKMLGFKESDKETVYSGLVHLFLTSDKGVSQKEFAKLLENTKWADKKDERLYDPDERKFCNFVGVVSKEFEVTKKEIIEAAQKKYASKVYGKNNPNNPITVKLTLQIISRFDTLKQPYFLQTMLLKGRNLCFSNQEVLADNDGYFDFLLMPMFRNSFIDASNKGYYKAYHNFSGNDAKLRGSIDFARHIRQNIGLKNGNIAYSYRENSVINYLNMIILAAYDCLKRKYSDLVRNFLESDSELVSRISFLKYELMDNMCDLQTIISKNLTPISHPYYFEYDFLRSICLKILRNEGMGYEDNSDSAQGILYYMPDLWEEYLYEILYNPEYDLKEQHIFHIFSYDDNDEHFKQVIKPDFVFFDKETDKPRPFMILDAKFKREWWERIKKKNILGMINKMSLMPDYDECIRNMNSYAVNATGVVFPVVVVEENEAKEYMNHYENNSTHNISVYNTKDHFYTFPIFVPQVIEVQSYDDWLKQFNGFNKTAKETIAGIVNKVHNNTIKIKPKT